MSVTDITLFQLRDKNFSSTRGTSCLESGNQMFLDSVSRNESNSQ